MRKTRIILFTLMVLLGTTITLGIFDADPVKGSVILTTATVAAVGGLKDSKTLKEEKGQIWERAQALIKTAKEEKRSLTEEETSKYDEYLEQMRKLDEQIKRAEETERRMLEMAGTFINKKNKEKEKKEVRHYSFLRAIRLRAEGRDLDGLEKEMHDEAVKEARNSNISITGIGVPSVVLQSEKRDLQAGTSTKGGYTVFDEPGSFIEALRAKLLIQVLGANVMTGLQGDMPFPAADASAVASWTGEVDTASETSSTFRQPTMSPHRLAAFSLISKQLINQSSIDVENFVRSDLMKAIQIAVDAAAINGSGSSNQPTGILNTTGIGSVVGGTNGAAITWDHIVELEKEVAIDNADVGKLAYLTNPKVRGKLKKTKLDDGSGYFVWPLDGKLNGYNTGVSTQVPSNLTKGTGTNLSAVIFGNFNDLIIGQWGGLDMIVDPYTKATEGQVKVVTNSYWDILVRHAESFAAMVDAITT